MNHKLEWKISYLYLPSGFKATENTDEVSNGDPDLFAEALQLCASEILLRSSPATSLVGLFQDQHRTNG